MKRIGIISMVLVLAMGMLGVGYATWSQMLFIDGTVHTGTFLTGFESQESNDPFADDGTVGMLFPTSSPVDGTLDPGYLKNVGGTDCELLVLKGVHNYPDAPAVDMYEKIAITLDNVYPSYSSRVDFDIGNGGTIPAEVVSATIVSASHASIPDVPITLTPSTWLIIVIDGVIIKIGFHTSAADTQIDPCEADGYYLEFHIEQEWTDPDTGTLYHTEQGKTVTFDIEIKTIQWNKA